MFAPATFLFDRFVKFTKWNNKFYQWVGLLTHVF